MVPSNLKMSASMSTRSWRGSKAQIGAEPLPQSTKKTIALTGFMAVGKSVVGRRLARRLKRRFVDLDQTIEATEEMKIHEIFNRKGEAYFRKAEKRKLREILCQGGQVIATGGGAIMDEENLRLLKQRSWLICLTASPEVLLQRSGTRKERPLLEGDDRERRIKGLLGRREKSYAQAHVSIDTSYLSVDEAVEEIIAAIERLSGSKELKMEDGRRKVPRGPRPSSG